MKKLIFIVFMIFSLTAQSQWKKLLLASQAQAPPTNFYTSLDAANADTDTNALPPTGVSTNVTPSVETTLVSNGLRAIKVLRTSATLQSLYDFELGSSFVIGQSYTITFDMAVDTGGTTGYWSVRASGAGGWNATVIGPIINHTAATGAYATYTITG